MAGEFEAAGDLATGALLGRAVEPGAGEGQSGDDGICLNCATALIGPHCHRCGQAGHVHRSLSAMGHEILHGVFHFEGKLWHTLPMLVWRPGDLTRRYIEGERARFVSPMAIFLFSLFAMFAVFSWAGISAPTGIHGNTSLTLQEARKETLKDRDEDRAELATLAPGDARRKRLERNIAEYESDLRGLDQAIAAMPGGKGDLKASSKLGGWAPIDHALEKWNKNPALMLYKLQSNGYKFSWLLIPLSLPFLWLLFAWKRRYKLYDHTVFITYSIAFMSLLLIVLVLLSAMGFSVGWIGFASVAIPFVHLTRQLQQAYQLRWWSAVLRTVVLSLFIQIVLLLFLLILLALGAF